MTSGKRSGDARYRAFISYSHKDGAFAGRLHRRLEGYVLPRRLAAGMRLTPVFKDREELPAATDLSSQVRAALAASDTLIVVCSPDAAASPWVGREIEAFRALNPGRPILAALARGEPAEAFPPALAAGGVEPLAADFRPQADGERLALLKLVAGVAGVGVDQLVQRDAQRQLRRVTTVTAAALLALLIMSGMTLFALQARSEAERQRAEAESLVGFMQVDLRDGLKGAASLKVLSKVNQRALRYYASQDLASLSPQSRGLRALSLRQAGADDVDRGDLAAARVRFDEAFAETAALLAKDPNNPDRIYAHGQDTYWRGLVEYRLMHTAAARAAFEAYLRLAQRLQHLQPGSTRALRELANADGNLCSLALEQEHDPKAALPACVQALQRMSEIGKLLPEDRDVKMDLANRWAWLADVQVALGELSQARRSRLSEAAILTPLGKAEPDNTDIRERWGICQRGLSYVAYKQGNLAVARAYLVEVRETFRPLLALDPEKRLWRDQFDYASTAITALDKMIRKEARS